ncbi:MAG: HlyD family secretion protein [Solirubrobacterales bacterium]|nr:HlyD family secretion protein [Solirubrobacterales bacterium]
MSAPQTQQTPPSTAPRSEPTPPLPRSRARLGWIIAGIALGAAVVAGLPFLVRWVDYRLSHSLTDDVFVEAHIVNVAPQMVSGRIIRIHADENDWVEQGQVVAEIDPVPYQDRVDEARSKLEAATAELSRQEADLARLRREVPIRVEIAKRARAAAAADRDKAEKSLRLTRDEVEKGIDEALAAVKAARADLTLAQEEYGRFTRLYQQEASTQRRAQEVTRSRDASLAQVDLAEARLAKALAERTSIDVATSTLEVARTTEQRSVENVSLSETGYDEIRVAERMVEVKKRMVDEARRALETAENELGYTRLHAPFPGVVVHRYRHLGDFASPGTTILSMYNPELLYVEANLEETRLPGVAPGNPVRIDVDAFERPFRGRVVWFNKSTGAQFSLMPRNVVSGEFTHVVQRVPVRIWIEPDDRWPRLRAGLSAHVAIAHGGGDPEWAERMARKMEALETRHNAATEAAPPDAGEEPRGPSGPERS